MDVGAGAGVDVRAVCVGAGGGAFRGGADLYHQSKIGKEKRRRSRKIQLHARTIWRHCHQQTRIPLHNRPFRKYGRNHEVLHNQNFHTTLVTEE